jgi:two-component SAPR family response regulator
MTVGPSSPSIRRILVVEDEVLIGMLLEDMLTDLGYEVAASAARVEDAIKLAAEVEADAAILDVNLNGQEVYPVADILSRRQIPFVFATGYSEFGLPHPYQQHQTMQKPFQQETLERRLAALFQRQT